MLLLPCYTILCSVEANINNGDQEERKEIKLESSAQENTVLTGLSDLFKNVLIRMTEVCDVFNV